MHPTDHGFPVNTAAPISAHARPGSGLGLASFLLSMMAGLAMLVCFIVAAVVEVSDLGIEAATPIIELLGLGVAMLMFAQLVAAGLGIAALTQPQGTRSLAVLGTVFSVAALFGTLLLMLLGGIFAQG